MSNTEERKIFQSCERFLTNHHRKKPHQVLTELARATAPEESADIYGAGDLIENFEKEVAALLGKEAAVFMPSGTMAQPIALRIWCDRQGGKGIGLHPTSHLEKHEQLAYHHLHGLRGHLLGEKSRVLSSQDLAQAPEGLGAIILELPHREIGGVLPEWADLQKMSAWCREREIKFHLDGARLWECAPYYGKSYGEICGLFDSVYVSFYKGLGGIAGAILAGPESFIQEAKIWERRQGGNLISLYPYVISARAALALRLPRMRAYHEKAVEIAEQLGGIPQIQVVPPRPQTNMMHLLFRADLDRLDQAALEIARTKKVGLFFKVNRLEPGLGMLELSVGDATLDIPTAEIASLFQEALDQAK